jgi:Cytochrome c554 and c-prime
MSCSTSAFRSSCALAIVLFAGCTESAGEARTDAGGLAPLLTREQLLDPVQCSGCHPKHYREWASSMHAYAADDPVFRAMNQRGQRETEGALGDFCVRCHAPLALREGETRDGLNMDQVPAHLKGVTCYFCHNTVSTGDPFNAHLTLADDTTMRGGIKTPVVTGAHSSVHSPLHDRNLGESSRLCGSCHDVVTPHGVKLERTFLEYQDSLFAKKGSGFDTCSGCHMPGRPGRVAENADTETNERTVHEHLWPAVDVALSAFPDREAQRLAVECALSSNARIRAIRLGGLGEVIVEIETSAGHHQPSGTAQDRRLWVELIAYDAADSVLFESGVIADDEVEDKSPGEPGYDPNLVVYRDWLYDAEGKPVHMFWEAARSAAYPEGYTSLTLPVAAELNQPHALEAHYRIFDFERVARVTVRLRMRPIGMDVLHDLIDSGDLDPAIVAQMPTFTLHGTAVEWHPRESELTPLWPETLLCPQSYRCLLEPQSAGCE